MLKTETNILNRLNSVCIRSLLSYVAETQGSEMSFLQVGGNDGKRADPLNQFCKRYSWGGVIVEPVPQYFSMLQGEYSLFPQIELVNVALSSDEGNVDIFYVPKERVPHDRPWELGLASLDLQHMLNNGVAEERIEKVSVPVIAPRRLFFDRSGFDPFLIVIDVEGHEQDIISSIPFAELSTQILIFESKHMPEQTFDVTRHFLENFGFELFPLKADTIALRSASRWQRAWLSGVARLAELD